MVYDIEYYRPSFYYTPRYYSSYSPTYCSTFSNPYYSPSYRYSSNYTSSIRRPYRYNFDFDPDYRYRYYTTPTPRTPVWSAADRYSFIHGLTFRENAADIRYSADKLLEDIRSPRAVSVPRYTRPSSLDSGDYLDTVFRSRRAVSRGRMEAPSYHNISKTIVY